MSCLRIPMFRRCRLLLDERNPGYFLCSHPAFFYGGCTVHSIVGIVLVHMRWNCFVVVFFWERRLAHIPWRCLMGFLAPEMIEYMKMTDPVRFLSDLYICSMHA